MWPEIELAKKENRHEIKLAGPLIDNRIKEYGFDNSLYDLTSLNYLCLTGTSITSIPDSIQNLVNLQSLSLHTNKIDFMNPLVGKLTKLKLLDLSGNLLTEVPDIFTDLDQIVTINFSDNKLTKFPMLTNNKKLAELNLSKNSLEHFPEVYFTELPCLSTLNLCENKIKSIPDEINTIPALKNLDISSNQITSLPGNLSDCGKLKELKVGNNPISDNRLKKLIIQCRTKQILDYVRQNSPKVQTTTQTNSNKGKKNKTPETAEENKEATEDCKYKITVFHAKDDCSVTVSKNVETVRKNIICCVVQGVTFNEDSFKKFISLQNKIHEKECLNRQAATIATHDFKKLGSGQLLYTTKKPEDLKLIPLKRKGEMTGKELFERLHKEAETLKKEKKRQTYSGIHKYLTLIEGKPDYPCLLNSKGEVISFPPITNAEITKIEQTSTDIFLEVTNTEKLQVCRDVMSTLLRQMVLLFETDLNVLQIRVNNEEGTLKNVYPSKTDLNFKDIQVIRMD